MFGRDWVIMGECTCVVFGVVCALVWVWVCAHILCVGLSVCL